jgi:hypothetical protein
MAITGQAKADYMRDYMRRRRATPKADVRPGKTDEDLEALKAELAAVEGPLALAMETIKMLKASNKRLRNGEGEEEPSDEIERLKAELATANAEIWTLKTLKWGNHPFGDNQYLSMAETDAGAYRVVWTATNKPRGGGEKRLLPTEGESFEADFSPRGKDGRRRLKARPLGNFPTHDEALAACQAHARAQRV